MTQLSGPVTALGYTETAVITPDEDGLYVVSFPAFPDLATYGETLDEARAMAADCLHCYADSFLENCTQLRSTSRFDSV